jgi:hypothetical protein
MQGSLKHFLAFPQKAYFCIDPKKGAASIAGSSSHFLYVVCCCAKAQ